MSEFLYDLFAEDKRRAYEKNNENTHLTPGWLNRAINRRVQEVLEERWDQLASVAVGGSGLSCAICGKALADHTARCTANPAPDVIPGEIPENGQRWEP